MGGRTVVTTRRERGRAIRLMLVRGTRQSAMWLDDPFGECPFGYLQIFDVAFCADPRPRRVLLIGGAGYAWPRHVLSSEPDVELTVVECDPVMNDLARRWFYLDELERRHGEAGDGRLRLVVDDGLSYLRRCAEAGESFDAIVNDTFIAARADQPLMGEEAARLVRACLAPGGVYLTNVITALMGSGAYALDAVLDAFGTQFEQLSVVPCDFDHPEDVTNAVVIASDADQAFPGTWMTYAGVS